jgi:hypothetical protein
MHVRMRTRMAVSLGAACTVLGAMALSVGAALPAQAASTDYQPGAFDVVGDGSDTLQFVVDFGADGDIAADPGYNFAGNKYKLVNIDATADANARIAYANGSTLTTPIFLNPTAVYRAGAFPVQRINGSGAGINALLADTATGTAGTSEPDPGCAVTTTNPFPRCAISFARMSSNPTVAQGATAVTNGFQGLQQFVLGVEHLRAAAATAATNAPSMTALVLAHIYQCDVGYTTWNSANIGGTSADTIIPILPQAGSGTRNTFLADLSAALGVTVVVGSCVHLSEENDPTAITSLASTTTNPNGGTCAPNCSADAIAPMSGARLNLWSGLSGNTTFGANPGVGYFHDPGTVYPGATTGALNPAVVQLAGTPPAVEAGGTTAYNDTRNLNIVYRWTDQISTTPWQPGTTLNWAQALFCNPGGATVPFFQGPEGKLLIAEAGADPSTQSCLTTPLT